MRSTSTFSIFFLKIFLWIRFFLARQINTADCGALQSNNTPPILLCLCLFVPEPYDNFRESYNFSTQTVRRFSLFLHLTFKCTRCSHSKPCCRCWVAVSYSVGCLEGKRICNLFIITSRYTYIFVYWQPLLPTRLKVSALYACSHARSHENSSFAKHHPHWVEAVVSTLRADFKCQEAPQTGFTH